MNEFGIDEEEIQRTGDDGRLKRPIAVAVFGCLIATASIAIISVEANIAFKGETALFLIGFLAFAWASSCSYAFLGWRYSRELAQRIIGYAGGFVALCGLGFLFWLLLARGM